MKSYIREIRISNFKSFDTLELQLQNFNVIIGGNASGKSNFVQALKFLNDVSSDGLQSAISEQGGVYYLRNVNIASKKSMEFDIIFDVKHTPDQYIVSPNFAKLIKVISIEYGFSLNFLPDTYDRFEIERDEIEIKCQILTVNEPKDGSYPDRYKLTYDKNAESVQFRSREEKYIRIRLKDKSPESSEISRYDFSSDIEDENLFLMIQSWALSLSFKNDNLLLGSLKHMPIVYFELDIPVYNFDSRRIKDGSPVRGKSKLQNDGTNLALVVKNILSDKDQAKEIQTLLTYILPFVEGLSVRGTIGDRLQLEIKERYTPKDFFPSILMSDGTVNVMAMLVALSLERHDSTIVLEEPERNLHPHLIGKLYQ